MMLARHSAQPTDPTAQLASPVATHHLGAGQPASVFAAQSPPWRPSGLLPAAGRMRPGPAGDFGQSSAVFFGVDVRVDLRGSRALGGLVRRRMAITPPRNVTQTLGDREIVWEVGRELGKVSSSDPPSPQWPSTRLHSPPPYRKPPAAR